MYKRILTAVTVIVLLCLPTAWAADTSATAAILMDGDTGEVLYEKNPDRQMLIASTTKLMTTLVVLERGGLGDVVTVTQQHIAEGSSMYLKPGDRVTVEELLYGLLLCSGNDAALALADHCGGLERFVAEMNRKAAELNRTDHLAFLSGYANGTFEPDRNMTRAEVTTMFARLLAEKMAADQTYSNTFSDVAKSHWAANYIGYMQQFGIITGYADGSFRPDASVTRAEFAAIASRFERLTEGTKSFSDVPSSHWAAKYINFAATRGWVNGYADGTFRPNNSITRAEVAAVTCRLLERNADQSYIRSHLSELRAFTDVSESHWAYWYTMEAANGHDYTKSGSSETWSRTYR